MRLLAWLMVAMLVACGQSNDTALPVAVAETSTTTLNLLPTTSAVATTVAEAETDPEPVDHEADGDHHDAEPVGEAVNSDRTIEVVMTEYAFEPGTFLVTAGETITFVVHNDGEDEHEFRLTTAEFADHHIAEEHSDHHDDEPGVLLVDPGQVGSMTVTFHTAGEYDVVACLLPDHYELGMVAPLEIDAGLDY